MPLPPQERRCDGFGEMLRRVGRVGMTAISQDDGQTLREGDTIEDYRIERILGAGSFGVTYLARDENLDRQVAIKEYMPVQYARRHANGTISSRNAETSGTFEWGLDRFSQEARTLAQFNHHNIVRILRIVQGLNGTSYIVMELLGGTNLESWIEQNGPLETPKFLSIFNQLLDGMRAVHKLGILHRDIKPANIVLEDRGPVIIDFGAARDLAMQQKAGFSALVTDGFSPPEQYSSKNLQNPSSDIYALAATAHYLLSGRIPPPSAARHAGEELEPAAELRGDLPADIASGIDRALELRMAERPRSIDEWMEQMPSLSAVPEPEAQVVYVERKGLGLDRRGLLLLGGGLVLAGGAAALLIGRDNAVSSSAGALEQGWSVDIGPLSSEPYPGIFATDEVVHVAAHTIGADGNDRLLVARVSPQGKETGRYVHDEPGSRGHAVLVTGKGAVIVGGESPAGALVTMLDGELRPQWSRTYSPGSVSSLMQLGDSVVAGLEGPQSSGQAKLLFLAGDGSVRNEIVLLDRRGDTVQRIAALSDGSIAVLGSRLEQRVVNGQSKSVAGMWLARVAPSGEELWRLAESGLGYANGIDVIEAGENLFVSGKTSPDDDPMHYRTMVMRVSAEGQKLWTRWDYDPAPSSGRGMAHSGDGSPRLYMVGRAGEPKQARIAQIGPDGDFIWQGRIGRAGGRGDVTAGLAIRPDGAAYALGIGITAQDSLILNLTRME